MRQPRKVPDVAVTLNRAPGQRSHAPNARLLKVDQPMVDVWTTIKTITSEGQ